MKKYKQHAIHGNGFEREKKKKSLLLNSYLFIFSFKIHTCITDQICSLALLTTVLFAPWLLLVSACRGHYNKQKLRKGIKNANFSKTSKG